MVHKDLANLTLCSLMHNHPTSQKAIADTLEILAEGSKDNANKHMANTGLYMLTSSLRMYSGVSKTLMYTVLSQSTVIIHSILASSAQTPSL